MKTICIYFQVHQPVRLRRIKTFQANDGSDYWDHTQNQAIFDRASDKCYLPANRMILELIRRSNGAFRVAYSVSGTFLEQAERFRPDVLQSFQDLAATGCVEFLAETYYHSLAGLWDEPEEFEQQVAAHRRACIRLLGQEPRVFRNTELIFDDRIAQRVQDMGFAGILTEGAEKMLGSRSPNHLYKAASCGLPVLAKNYRLSDDVAFRFSAHDWPGFPLMADKYTTWLDESPGETINLFMDYETIGEHQWQETGIFDFLWHLPEAVLTRGMGFATPSETLARLQPSGAVSAPQAISWADQERDVSAWLGNKMQVTAFQRLRDMRNMIVELDDPERLHAFRLLQTSDHLYYCSTKNMADGQIHAYFSPYRSPYLAYINHINAIEDLRDQALRARYAEQPQNAHIEPRMERPATAARRTADEEGLQIEH